MKKNSLGMQHLVEFFGCSVACINNKKEVQKNLLKAAQIAKATVVAESFYEFHPYGISGVIIIAESHIALHSWPEHQCVSLDFFTCSNKMNPEAAIYFLQTVFQAQEVQIQKIIRGEKQPVTLKLPVNRVTHSIID